MRIVITGGSGFIGKALCRELCSDHEVVALSRNPNTAMRSLGSSARVVQWDGSRVGEWSQELEGSGAVVNLAGENVASGRWSRSRKSAILQSRLAATRAVLEGLGRSTDRPKVVVQASAVGYYGSRGEEQLDEASSAGAGFLAEVCRQWEEAIKPAEALGVRVVTTRLGVVVGSGGGLMARVLPAFRFFRAGYPGTGRQWFSWIHIDDVVGAIRFLLEDENLSGKFNLVSPNPVVSRDFFGIVGEALGCHKVRAIPATMLKLVAGQMADEMLLAGQRVMPLRVLQAGYSFRYSDAGSAIESVVHRSN